MVGCVKSHLGAAVVVLLVILLAPSQAMAGPVHSTTATDPPDMAFLGDPTFPDIASVTVTTDDDGVVVADVAFYSPLPAADALWGDQTVDVDV